MNFNTASGNPYTIRTGFDENGDLIYNDRPDGVGRNTERGDAAVEPQPGGRLHDSCSAAQTTLPPGITVVAGGGGAAGADRQQQRRSGSGCSSSCRSRT